VLTSTSVVSPNSPKFMYLCSGLHVLGVMRVHYLLRRRSGSQGNFSMSVTVWKFKKFHKVIDEIRNMGSGIFHIFLFNCCKIEFVQWVVTSTTLGNRLGKGSL
jgi:hypothetical protein